MSWAYLFFRNPLISPGVEKQKEKTLMLGWHLVKRPPADEADDLFFCLESWNPRFGEDAVAEDNDAHLSLMMFLLI